MVTHEGGINQNIRLSAARSLKRATVILACTFLIAIGCSQVETRPDRAAGLFHQVRAGETLWSISQAYGVGLAEIARANRMEQSEVLAAGRVIFIPGARAHLDAPPPSRVDAPARPRPSGALPGEDARQRVPLPSAPSPPVPDVNVRPEEPPAPTAPWVREDTPVAVEPKRPPRTLSQLPPRGERDTLPVDKKRFRWPLRGEVKSRFGPQPNGMFLNGIRIAAPGGTAVVAAAAGQVIFSSTLRDYGETIIIRHEDHFATVYTHLGTRLVNNGDQVEAGMTLANLRETAGEADMNFEIRYRNKAYNPLVLLP